MEQNCAGDVWNWKTPAAENGPLELPASLAIRYLPRLPVPIPGIRDSADVAWKMLDGRIGYLYVRRIGANLIEQLDRAVGELGSAQGLIIDVRGNSGGGFDSLRSHRNFARNDPEEPDRPRFAGPIAVLVDARCISAGEGWTSWFVANKRARLFGETTAGASSRANGPIRSRTASIRSRSRSRPTPAILTARSNVADWSPTFPCGRMPGIWLRAATRY